MMFGIRRNKNKRRSLLTVFDRRRARQHCVTQAVRLAGYHITRGGQLTTEDVLAEAEKMYGWIIHDELSD